MNRDVLFVLGAVAIWTGWALAVRGVWVGFSQRRWPFALILGLAAAGILAAGSSLAPIREQAVRGVLRLPILWVIMPFAGWATVACLLAMGWKLVESSQALTDQERSGKQGAAIVWLVGAVLSYGWLRIVPNAKVTLVKGAIPFGFDTAVFVLIFLVLGIGAMSWAAQSAAARGFAKGFVHQAALLAGTVVFGLPFAFLLVTSFKEDRDMSSPNGIVWVPRITERVPYRDPNEPYFEAHHEGERLEGVVIADLPERRKRLDIVMPLALRGQTVEVPSSSLKEIDRQVPLGSGVLDGKPFTGLIIKNLDDGRQRIQFLEPRELKGQERIFNGSEIEPVRKIGLNWTNYPEALSYLPPEADYGLVYLRNTLLIVILSVLGTLISSSIVGYAFSRMKFPGKDRLFAILLATMMLPGAVTLLPQFLIFRSLGWVDTLNPLWVPAFFGSAFNIFLLRQFFMSIPMELEDAAKIDGCSYLRTFWSVMLPQIKPALAVIFLWTFLASWNNFLGPLIYISSPENMPLAYALQLFAGERGAEPGYLMAFATLTMVPVLALYVVFQRYFVQGVTLSGLGGR